MPLVGSSQGGLWRSRSLTLDPSSTGEGHKLLFDTFAGVAYTVHAKNTTEDKYALWEVRATRASSDTLEDSIISRLGDKIDLDINISKVGSDMLLSLTNNELFSLSITVSFMILSR